MNGPSIAAGRGTLRRWVALAALISAVAIAGSPRVAHAQSCEVPIIVQSNVKPNVLIAFDSSASMRELATTTGAPVYNANTTTYKSTFETYLASLDVNTSPVKKHMQDLLGNSGNTGFTDAAIYDAAENKVCNDYKSGNCSSTTNLSWAAKCNLGAKQDAVDGPAQCVDAPGGSNTGKVPRYNDQGISNPNNCWADGKGIANPDMTNAQGRQLNSTDPCKTTPQPGYTNVETLFQGKFLNYLHGRKSRDDVARQVLRNLVNSTQTQINWGLMNFVVRRSTTLPGPAGLGGLLTAQINGVDSVASATNVISALRNYSGTVGWDSALTANPPTFTQTGMMMNSFGSTELADQLRDAVKYFQGTLPNPGGGNYASPIAYSCQPNFTVVATDGFPTNDDMKELGSTRTDAAPSISSYCTNDHGDLAREGTDDDDDAFDDYADCVNKEIDLSSSLGGRQKMEIYTIGFAEDVVSAADFLTDAATGGGGEFYPAADEAGLIQAFANVTKSILERSASATSAAVVSTSGVGTDILVTANFETVSWNGQLKGFALPYTTTATPIWKAGDLLEARAASTRNVYAVIDGADADTRIDDRVDFTVANEATLRSYLGAATSTEGSNLINWVRGTDGYGYRARDNDQDGQVWKLGDIINSNPVVVGAPPFFYPQSSYQSFYATYENRSTVIYVASNDGMLHAFDAATGAERWALIPNWNLPVFKQYLTDPNYCHRFTFDGSPRVVDAYFGVDGAAAAWHTVLVVGAGAHGGYIALDITDPGPANAPNPPVVLWQWPNPSNFAVPGTLAEARLGEARARPAIHFLHGGTFPTTTTSWFATIPSGINNSDGDAYLFNIALDTGLSDSTRLFNVDPADDSGNGLTDPAIIDMTGDQATDRVYVGDRNGKLWRWDVGQTTNPTQLIYNAGSTRPITDRPILSFRSTLPSDTGVIAYFGTGKYEVSADISDVNVQRLYAILDVGTRAGTPSTALITDANLTNATNSSTGNSSKTLLTSGWYIDLKLDSNGEPGSGNTAAGARVLYPGVLTNGIYFVTVFTPTAQVCDLGGLATLMAVNAATGSAFGAPVLDINGDGTVDSADVRSGQPARAVALGTGVPSQPVMDAERQTLIVQTSDTLLHPVKISTGGSAVSVDRWKILNR